MSEPNFTRRVTALALVLAGFAGASPFTPAYAADSRAEALHAQMTAGKALYVGHCAGCHGSGGVGAIGPALADKNLKFEIVQDSILNGRTGTPMPSFKDDLDAAQQGQIVAYIVGLTSGGRLPTDVVVIDAQAGGGRPSSKPISIGKDEGTPAAGAALFFDATKIDSCRACHTYSGKGGPVGPDLVGVVKTPIDVYQSVSRPKSASANFPALKLELRDGTHWSGIKARETADEIALYDVSILPPVLRTIARSDVAAMTALKNEGTFDHGTLKYSKQDLLDLSAFLGRMPPPAGRP